MCTSLGAKFTGLTVVRHGGDVIGPCPSCRINYIYNSTAVNCKDTTMSAGSRWVCKARLELDGRLERAWFGWFHLANMVLRPWSSHLTPRLLCWLGLFWADIVSAVPMHCFSRGESVIVWVWDFFLIQVFRDDRVLFCFSGALTVPCDRGVFETSPDIGRWLDTKHSRKLGAVYLD